MTRNKYIIPVTELVEMDLVSLLAESTGGDLEDMPGDIIIEI